MSRARGKKGVVITRTNVHLNSLRIREHGILTKGNNRNALRYLNFRFPCIPRMLRKIRNLENPSSRNFENSKNSKSRKPFFPIVFSESHQTLLWAIVVGNRESCNGGKEKKRWGMRGGQPSVLSLSGGVSCRLLRD